MERPNYRVTIARRQFLAIDSAVIDTGMTGAADADLHSHRGFKIMTRLRVANRLECHLLVILSTVAGFAMADEPQKTAGVTAHPNIVFLLADDLGYGDLGCYGQQQIKTPNIDRLAAGGMRFTQFYAGCTVCAPSRCTLMTGLHTGHCRVRGNDKNELQPDDTTVAAVLKSAGYATGLCGKWGLGGEGSMGMPTRQGFDYFYGYLDQHHAHNYYPAYLFRNEERVPLKNVVPGAGPFGSNVATVKAEYSHDLIAKESLDFIDRNKQQPFFLYVAFTIPHANNEDRPNGMEVPDYGIYADRDWPATQKGHAAMISRMDADVGRIVSRLKELGLAENTIVFFSSDNGPHKEGGNDPQFNHSSGPLRGIKRDLYEGGIRVPLIAYWPNKIAAGSTSDFAGAFWDFFPTWAGLAGATDRVPHGFDGLSIVPTLLGNAAAQKQHDYLYWAFYEGASAQAARLGNWKGVEEPYGSALQLFDLASDLAESTNVATQHPDVVERMKKVFADANTPSEVWHFPAKKSAQ